MASTRVPARCASCILAISYKRDAACNLGARVGARCHPDHASRLDSLTFDAFAKGLVDRFGQALPARWRPRPEYEIMPANEALYRGFLNGLGAPPAAVGRRADIEALGAREFEREHLFGRPLPVEGWDAPTPADWAADRFWVSSLHEGDGTRLSFPMIGRLAELLLRTNPVARDALRLTYSHLFMDEFQDTTQVQYGLVRTVFLGCEAPVTAVGDNKQQIMRFAMAMDDPFGAFEADFGATRTPLVNNYRSSPGLVRIQHVLAQALDPGAAAPVSKAGATVDGEGCSVWEFSTLEAEAARLAAFVGAQMEEHGLGARDVVLLVRQKASDYAPVLAPAFAARGLALRDETGMAGAVMLQDLLVEEVSEIVVRALRLATGDRGRRHWSACLRDISALRGIGADDGAALTRDWRKTWTASPVGCAPPIPARSAASATPRPSWTRCWTSSGVTASSPRTRPIVEAAGSGRWLPPQRPTSTRAPPPPPTGRQRSTVTKARRRRP